MSEKGGECASNGGKHEGPMPLGDSLGGDHMTSGGHLGFDNGNARGRCALVR